LSEHPITDQMLADKNATGHSIFGPSSAHRWMRCAASLIKGYLAGDRPTKYAAEGSVAHWLAEDWLNNGNPYRHLGTIHEKDGFEIEITEEMISYIEEYVGRVSSESGRHYVEVKVDLSQYTPVPSFGTSDHIHAQWQKLKVKDLKYGKVWVEASENEQGLAYALGAFHELDWLYDFQEIEIGIIQPRRDNYDEWIVTRAELLEFGERYREAAHKAWDPEAPYTPGPIQCEYCPARFTCPALADSMRKIAIASFDDLDEEYTPERAVAVIEQHIEVMTPVLPAYAEMPLAQLAAIYEWRQTLEKWFREAYDYLLHQLELGKDVPGQKLGKGRAGNRKWTNAEAARRFLLRHGVEPLDLYDQKFIGPATASELLRISEGGSKKATDAKLADFVWQPPGKLTMIPADDSRPAIASAASAFDDIED
jgi:hypothetical protein